MKTSRCKYRYYLSDNYTYWYDFSILFQNINDFYIQLEWGEIYRDKIIIYLNYTWDGATGPVWQGKKISPDKYPISNMPILQERSEHMRDTTVATLIHDFLYQFLYIIAEKTNLKINVVRKFSDIIFRDILIQFNFLYSGTYYRGVRFFGKLWHKISSIFKK